MYGIGYDKPTFNPGDKVRVTKHSGYFAFGDICEVEHQSGETVFVKHGTYQRMGLPIDADALELIEAADCTGRNGQPGAAKARPKFKAGDVVRCLKDSGYSFTAGKTYIVREYPSKYGLLGIIEDDRGSTTNGWGPEKFELIAEPEAGNKEPKFKAGDVVVFVPSADMGDQRFTIKGVRDEPYGGELAYDFVEGGFDVEKYLVLAADCPQDNVQQPCIVALTKNGQPLPATRPYIHASVASATTEAERLARNNPGQEFAVYQRVAGRVAEVSYEMKEVA